MPLVLLLLVPRLWLFLSPADPRQFEGKIETSWQKFKTWSCDMWEEEDRKTIGNQNPPDLVIKKIGHLCERSSCILKTKFSCSAQVFLFVDWQKLTVNSLCLSQYFSSNFLCRTLPPVQLAPGARRRFELRGRMCRVGFWGVTGGITISEFFEIC